MGKKGKKGKKAKDKTLADTWNASAWRRVDPVTPPASSQPGAARAAGAPGPTPAERALAARSGTSAGLGRSASATIRRPAELAATLFGLGTRLQRQLDRTDGGDGLTRARLSALALLVLGGPRTLGELAAGEGVRPPTMTRLVQTMEADGLVTREPHPTDGRSIIVRATPAGETLLEDGRASRTAALADAIGRLDTQDRARLAHAFDLLERLLRDAGPGRPAPGEPIEMTTLRSAGGRPRETARLPDPGGGADSSSDRTEP